MSESSVTSSGEDDDRDQRLEAVIADYICACETGPSPDRRKILECHPDLADDLRQFFGQHDRMNQMAEPIRDFGDAVSHSLGPGQRLSYVGNYELLEEIARGGMGVVYKARQTTLGRIVAVKMIVTGPLASEQDVQRFMVEAREAGGLQHPNIVAIHEVGQHEGWHYFSMDYVKGRDLSAILRENVLSAKQAATYVHQMAEAIHYAHLHGTLHRDLKPSNILIDENDQVRITDFGLAMRVEGDSELTQTGQVLGTPSYMPPEQAQGKRSLIGPGSDVYSLGAILYECLTGRAPFRADSVLQTMEQVIHMEAASPRVLNPAIPRDLETICLKCLQKESHRRYGTAQLLADDLQRYLNGDAVTARPPSTGYRLRKAIRKHRAAFVSGTVFMLLLLAGLISTGTMWLQAQREATRASKAEVETKRALREVQLERLTALGEAERARAAEVKASEEASKARAAESQVQRNLVISEKNAYGSNMLLAQRCWEEKRINPLAGLLDLYHDRDDLRGFEWYYWNRRIHRELLTVPGFTESVDSVDFSPDGKRIVAGGGLYGSQDPGEVKVLDAESGKELLKLQGALAWIWSVDFSPDGERVVGSGGDSSVQVWDANDGQELLRLSGHTGNVWSVGYSPDNTRIVSGGHDQTVRVWDAVTGQELFRIQAHPQRVRSVSFSPDGKRIVSGSDATTIKVWNAVTGQETLELEGHPNGVVAVSFSADGKRIVSGGKDNTAKVWDATTGQEILTLTGHTGAVWSVKFSSDGKRITSVSQDRTVRLWDTETGKEIITFIGHSHLIHGVSFSPDGKRIASGSFDQTVRVWDAETEQDPLTLIGHSNVVSSARISPDGKWIASGGEDRTVKLWDAETGLEMLTLKGHTRNVNSVGFSPDGKRLVSASQDKTVQLWDAANGLETLTLNGHRDSVLCASFSPDGKRVVSSSRDDTIKVWDAATGQEMLTLIGHVHDVRGVSFSPDGKRLVSGSRDKTVKLWDAETGEEKLTMNGHLDSVSSVSFSPDGKRIVSGSDDATVKVWDVETGQATHTLRGHTDFVKSVRFSPDGKRIVSGSGDNTVRLWNAETRDEMLTLTGHTDMVRSVDFSLDGKQIVSSSKDMKVKVWDARPWTAEQRHARTVAEQRRARTVAQQATTIIDARKKTLLETAARLKNLADETPDDIAVARQLANTYHALAEIYKQNEQDTQADQADSRARMFVETSVNAMSLKSLVELIQQHDEWGVPAADRFDRILEQHPVETVLAIRGLLQDRKPDVRRASVLAFVRLFGKTEAVDHVQKTLNDHTRDTPSMAASVLEAKGTRADVAIPALLDAARDEDPRVAHAAIAALGRIGADPEIVICVLTAIGRDDRSRQRKIAMTALGKIGPAAKAAVPVVVAALTEDDVALRAVAKQTLRHIDPQLAATQFGPPFDAVEASLQDRATLKVGAADWPQWGGSRQRNNTPSGENIPIAWDIKSGKNIKWTVKLGSETYANPCIANGKVFIGTNNGNGYLRRYPASVDLGVLLCFDEAAGKFLWQYSSPKLASGRVHDWPNQGMPSTPLADGDRLWATTNRCEIVCLDAEGFHDNENDGPFREETNENHDEADIIWRFDMMQELGVSPHNMSQCSVLMADGVLFVCTSNGVDEGHFNIPAPDAPSFIAMDRDTGKILWTDSSPGRNILHAQWASPSYGVFAGQPQVLFPGGDGWLYSFDPDGDGQGNSKLLWKFDCNPKESKYTLTRATRNHFIGFACIYDGLVYIAVGEDPEHGDGQGHLWCIDPTKRGDVSPTIVYNSENPEKPIAHKRLQALDEKAGDFERENPNSAAVWHYVGNDPTAFETTMHRTMGTVAIRDDLLYVLDFGGLFHCVNAKTGKAHWMYDMFAECWGSPLIVEDQVYIGDTDGEVAIFHHSADPGIAMPMGNPLAVIHMNSSIISTPVVANNVLYIVNRNMLYAIESEQ